LNETRNAAVRRWWLADEGDVGVRADVADLRGR